MSDITEEKVFFEQGKVKVTSSRFVAVDRTFAMANITSVRSLRIEAKRSIYGTAFAVIGALIAVEQRNILIGVILFVGGVIHTYIQIKKRDKFVVAIATSGGEVHAHDASESYVGRVVDAINAAIVYRG